VVGATSSEGFLVQRVEFLFFYGASAYNSYAERCKDFYETRVHCAACIKQNCGEMCLVLMEYLVRTLLSFPHAQVIT